MPYLKTIGQVGQELVNDLTFNEFYSTERKYLVTLLDNKIINIQTFDDFKVAYNPQDFMRVIEFLNIL